MRAVAATVLRYFKAWLRGAATRLDARQACVQAWHRGGDRRPWAWRPGCDRDGRVGPGL